MKTLNLQGLTSVSGYRVAVAVLAVGLAGCASMGGGGASNPAVGTWATTVDSPIGIFEQTLTLNADMTGLIFQTLPEEGTVPISDVMVDGQSLSFTVVAPIQGQEITFKFQGKVDGDAITGEYVSDFGNATLTGTRK